MTGTDVGQAPKGPRPWKRKPEGVIEPGDPAGEFGWGAVDLGGSRLRWVLLSATRRSWRSGEQPAVPPSQLPNTLRALFHRHRWPPIERLMVGSKGVWTRAERTHLAHKLRSLAKNILVLSDVELGFWSTPGRVQPPTGIHVIVGTGAIALGRLPGGQWVRAGGMGPLRGDEGSGFWIGREFLRRVKKVDDKDIQRRSRSPADIAKIAAWARRGIERAHTHPTCAGILREAQHHIAELVWALERQFPKNVPISLSGGGSVFLNPIFQRGLRRILRKGTARQFRFLPPSPTPLLSAARRWEQMIQGVADRWPPRSGAKKNKRPFSQNPTA